MELFNCYICKHPKIRNEMASPGKNRIPFECKVCKRTRGKISYRNHINTYKARAPRRRFEARELLSKLKSEPCTDCKRSFHYCQMDFDHRDPTEKRLPISQMSLMGIQAILLEVQKCDLVCANCHRDRTQNQINLLPRSKLLTRDAIKAKEVSDFVNSLKNGKTCVDCLDPHPYWRLDFDHRINSDKRNTIARLKLSKYSKERILEEVEKCDLVCARCHRLRTWNRQREAREGDN